MSYPRPTETESTPVEQPSELARRRTIKPSTVVKLVLTLAISAFVIAHADLGAAIDTLRGADWWLAALAIGIAVVAMVFNVGRWKLMLRGQGSEAPLLSLIRFYLIGMFFNNVLPSRLGGDVVRAYGASLLGVTRTRSAASVLTDRLIGAISVLALGVVATLANSSRLPAELQQTTVVSLLAAGLVLAMLLYRNERLSALRSRALDLFDVSIFGFRPRRLLQEALDALRSYSRSPGLIARGFAISLVANGFSIVNLYLYARAVRVDAGLGDVATISPFILAVGLIPVSINGLGTIELAYVVMFGLLGVLRPDALAIALLRRLALLVLSLAGGLLYTARRFS